MSEKHDAGSMEGTGRLSGYVTPITAWALSLGCCVGWGSLVMPGTTFLPMAGPMGTLIGFVIGTLVMVVIVVNYSYMIRKHPGAGGTFLYATEAFGYDHGFLAAWFLLLTYVAMLWANATALTLIVRNLVGGVFQFGIHYELAGFDVYLGEVLLSCAAILVFGLLCLRGRAAGILQSVFMALFCAGVLLCFVSVMAGNPDGINWTRPAFSPDRSPMLGIFGVVTLAPWAFVGFENVSHSSEEFTFSTKKIFPILLVTVVVGAAAYVLLTGIAASAVPAEYAGWPEYIRDVGNLSGVKGLPIFNAVKHSLGTAGTLLLGVTAFCAISTSLIGNMVAASRLLFALSREDMAPRCFGRLNGRGVPEKAVVAIMCVSFIIPFFGRTAIGWIVDVNTVGATIAYAYTSSAAWKLARGEGKRKNFVFGAIGMVLSALFVLYFIVGNALAAESYLILTGWSIAGFFYFRSLFQGDTHFRLGRSIVVWIVLLAMIFFTSLMWMVQTANKSTRAVAEALNENYQEELEKDGLVRTEEELDEMHEFLQGELSEVRGRLMANSLVQSALVLISLMVLFSIYRIMQQHQRQMEIEKVLAEESSRAKTSFLSNMSHEIRTPLNAIIGLDNIALREPDLPPRTVEQLEKIGGSARHLLGLINDILDMSRIESGRMVLKNEEFSFRDFLDQVSVMINGQCQDKGLTYECVVKGHVEGFYMGDSMKLKQVLINILGNSVKFTEPPGKVTLVVEQVNRFEDMCTIRFIMKDTGIGMDKEYIPKIFEAFSQEDSTTTNRYGGSGLGMAITRNIVQMMKGEITVESEKGVGSTFTVTVSLRGSDREPEQRISHHILDSVRVLVVDDDPVALEHAKIVLDEISIHSDICGSAQEALEKIRNNREAGCPYHILFSDMRMPDMDGISLTRKIRGEGDSDMAIILLTGYSWDDVEQDAREAGVEDFMSKPLFPDTVLRMIRSVLEHKDVLTAEIAAESPEEEEAPDFSGMVVLLAEDVEINAEIMIDLLDMEGITVEHAVNGQVAVDMFNASEPGHYDVILMDVRMPVMDGLTAAGQIRGLDRPDAKTVPIIALTANAFEEDVQNSLNAGMDAHLSKPIEIERLYETLLSLTAGRKKKEKQDQNGQND